jgi:hypothetical protein
MSKRLVLSFAVLLSVPAFAQSGERIAWQHPSLELYRAGVSDQGGRARIELCVQAKQGARGGATSVGYPRYRTSWGAWKDCVVGGLDRSRSLHAAADTSACFSVLLPEDAAELELPMGDRILEIPVAGWLNARASDPTPEPELEREPEPDASPGPVTQVEDPWGDETTPAPVPAAAAAPPAGPKLVLAAERTVEGAAVPVARDQIVSVHLRVQNAGGGAARGAAVWIEPGPGVFAAKDGASRIDLGDVAPGGAADFVYRCYADRSAAALSFQVTLEQAGSVAVTSATVVSFPLAQAGPPPRPASDVDGDVAASVSARPSALAVVFGVGAYAKAPGATFAAADAKTATRYFEKALGIPAARIELLLDGEVTLGQMQRIFGSEGWLARRVSPDSEVFIFFAGHGMAETEKFSPYLLPTDGDPDYLRQTAFSLDKLIGMLGSLGARRTTLFLDACFSGLSREGVALLDNARPLFIEQVARVPSGLSVFSAGSRGQIVSSLDEQGHGVFSYYLFKGIAGDADLDHDRRILASELKSYLEDTVPRAAQSLDREQNPNIVLADPEEVLVQLP